jgi:hypothetical protein
MDVLDIGPVLVAGKNDVLLWIVAVDAWFDRDTIDL